MEMSPFRQFRVKLTGELLEFHILRVLGPIIFSVFSIFYQVGPIILLLKKKVGPIIFIK